MTRVAALWAASDVNADGLLDLTEFKTYSAAERAHMIAQGTFGDELEGADEENYNICNDINPAVQGISQEEFLGIMGHYMAEMEKLKNE